MTRLFGLTIGLAAAAGAALAQGFNPVPEPGTLFLVVGGLGALILVARRRKKK